MVFEYKNEASLREVQSNLCRATTKGKGQKWSLVGVSRYIEPTRLKNRRVLHMGDIEGFL